MTPPLQWGGEKPTRTSSSPPQRGGELSDRDREIGALIEARTGKANAIKGHTLALAVFSELMLDEGAYESRVRRLVEDSVERLRESGVPIAASKARPMGYYIPATAEECDEVHDRFFNEGVRRIKHSQIFRRDKNLVQVLRGQLEIEGTR